MDAAVHAVGDRVVHSDFGICGVVEVKGRLIRIRSLAIGHRHRRCWVDLSVDAGKVKLDFDEDVHAVGDVVVHSDFGICDVAAVRSLGRLICIQRHANNDRLWVDLDVDPGALESVKASDQTVIWKGKTYVRLSSKPIGGVKQEDPIVNEDKNAYMRRAPHQRKAARRAAKKAKTDQNGSATHLWGVH